MKPIADASVAPQVPGKRNFIDADDGSHDLGPDILIVDDGESGDEQVIADDGETE